MFVTTYIEIGEYAFTAPKNHEWGQIRLDDVARLLGKIPQQPLINGNGETWMLRFRGLHRECDFEEVINAYKENNENAVFETSITDGVRLWNGYGTY